MDDEARLTQILTQITEGAKAKGVSHVYPTTAIENEDSRSDVYHLTCEMFGDSGTFRTIEALSLEDLAKLAGVEVSRDDQDALGDMLYDLEGYWESPEKPKKFKNPVMCFWSEPDNPYPGTAPLPG